MDNYGRGLRTEFHRKGKIIDLDHECDERKISPYDIPDGTPCDRTTLPDSIVISNPPELPLVQSLTLPDILRHKENVLRLIREVCRESCHSDSNMTDAWALIRGRAGKGPFNRLKDCYLNRGTELYQLMYGAAIDELESELKRQTKLGPFNTLRLVFGNSRWKDRGLTVEIWRMIASQTATRLAPAHPVRSICEELRRLLDNHGHQTFLELLEHCAPDAVQEIETHYGKTHPYALESWLYVVRYCGADRERLGALLPTINVLLQEVREGSHEDISLREYFADVTTAMKCPRPQCKACIDHYLSGVQARENSTTREERQDLVTLALAHHRVWDVSKDEVTASLGGMKDEEKDEALNHLDQSIEYLSMALHKEWTTGIKSIARVISWISILETWLREAGQHGDAEAMGRRRREIQGLRPPAGRLGSFVPLAQPGLTEGA